MIKMNDLTIEYKTSRKQNKNKDYSIYQVKDNNKNLFVIGIPSYILKIRTIGERNKLINHILCEIYNSTLDNLKELEQLLQKNIHEEIELREGDYVEIKSTDL